MKTVNIVHVYIDIYFKQILQMPGALWESSVRSDYLYITIVWFKYKKAYIRLVNNPIKWRKKNLQKGCFSRRMFKDHKSVYHENHQSKQKYKYIMINLMWLRNFWHVIRLISTILKIDLFDLDPYFDPLGMDWFLWTKQNDPFNKIAWSEIKC